MAEVEAHVPAPLVPKRDKHGRAEIEVGYVRFRAGTHELPATEELAWAIAVERQRGIGFAFYAMNIAADNRPFLDWNADIGFSVHRAGTQFSSDLERRSYAARDDEGPLCVLRHEPEGSVWLPFFPISTEVWTQGSDGVLKRRIFQWRGQAQVHLAPAVASTLHEHSFFKGVRVGRAEPLPSIVFSSAKHVRRAAQLFSEPRAAQPT